MSWLRKDKKEEFTKYEPDVSKIKKEKPVESVEVIDEPEIVEEIEGSPNIGESEDEELEDLKRRQKEVEEKIERAKKKESRIMVVKELPEAPIRRYRDKDGSIVDLITIEEAISEILTILKS